jgi:hypothetical protein
MNDRLKNGHWVNIAARMGCAALLSLAAGQPAAAAPVNSLFNPADYPALTNDFTVGSGSIVINTMNGTNAPTWTYGANPPLYGQVVTNQSGSNVLALFSFGNLALSNAVSCTVTGNLGLVLCSTGNITLANTLDLSGGTNGSGAGGLGGPGGEAGVAATSFRSSPPNANHGTGGGSAGQNGYGYGGGGTNSSLTCGGGGGFGGPGGYATWSSAVAAGGTNYGDNILTCLFGGSGGAGTSYAQGGGGGGALALIANGSLSISVTATQKVNGAAGGSGTSRCPGGGSGGGLILAANNLIVAGVLQAIGGNGASSGNTLGGGGGGGRIVLYANTLATNGMSWSMAGGAKGTGTGTSGGSNGGAGTFRYAGDGITSDPLGGNLTYPFVSVALPPQIASPSVTNVTATSATLQAHLITDGGAITTVSVFWGTTNRGTTAAAWANTNSFASGQWTANSNPSTNLATLTTNQNYYYTFDAVNSVSGSWTTVSNFITGALNLQVLDATCGVSAADTAVVQVTRPAACTNETIPVYYTTGGNATNNADYSASPASGSLVISNGQTSALLTLTPLSPWNYGTPRNFTVSLLPGPYVTGTANSATCTLGHYVSSLVYSGTVFTESWLNDGSIANSITVTMPTNSSNGFLDLFSGVNGEDFAADGKVVFGSVPAGLTASAIRTATNTIQLYLNGYASNYLVPAGITNLLVTFQNSAFAGGNASIVGNAASALSVNFVSAYTATNWYVSTTGSDTNSGTLASPFATVQQAVNMARANANDVIHLLPGTYTQSNIWINVAVTLTGNTRDDTILQAGSAPYASTNANILDIATNAVVRNLTLRYANGGSAISGFNYWPYTLIVDGCRLTQNSTGNNGLYDGGAAVLFGQNSGNGSVVIRNSDLSSNHANGDGGAVRILTWGLTISNCTLTGNSASREDGAVYAGGGAAVYDSLLSSNSAGDSTGAIGLGVAASTISGCTLAFNSAATNAGAFSSSQISVQIVNSTCYSNTAGLAGGAALFWCNNAAVLNAYNSTFYQNSCGTTAGAIWVTGALNLYSSIVASNTAGVFGPDIFISGNGTTATNSLVGNTVGAYFGTSSSFLPVGSPNAYGCYVGTNGAAFNPMLLPLANNGGKTPTCALQAGSLAIDHGSNPLGLLWDQRGVGYARATGKPLPLPDIGAYELGSGPTPGGTTIFFR